MRFIPFSSTGNWSKALSHWLPETAGRTKWRYRCITLAPEVGWFGQLPTNGDTENRGIFVRLTLPPSFTPPAIRPPNASHRHLLARSREANSTNSITSMVIVKIILATEHAPSKWAKGGHSSARWVPEEVRCIVGELDRNDVWSITWRLDDGSPTQGGESAGWWRLGGEGGRVGVNKNV